MSLGQRIKKAWVSWRHVDQLEDHQDPSDNYRYTINTSSYQPHQTRARYSAEKTLLASVLMRIAIDVAAVRMIHAKVDENGRFLAPIASGLQDCLQFGANIDQGASFFRQDSAMTLLEEGVVAIVPIETSDNPLENGSWDILNLRNGRVVEWEPQHVRVEAYNELTGQREKIRLPKSFVAIVENPLYAVMNDRNSTLARLTRKLNLLDVVDEQSSSGRLDLIIQLPYTIKSDARKVQAEERRKAIEAQLSGTKYGIAYADATEKITQLNRPVENNLFKQVEYLTNQLYSQMGITPTVIDGSASEPEMLNYYNRTVEPILRAITEAMTFKFLTKTARTQGQRVIAIRDPFALAEVTTIAELADKFTRNEIMSSNEIRAVVGLQPSKDPKADELRNSNMPQVEDKPSETT